MFFLYLLLCQTCQKQGFDGLNGNNKMYLIFFLKVCLQKQKWYVHRNLCFTNCTITAKRGKLKKIAISQHPFTPLYTLCVDLQLNTRFCFFIRVIRCVSFNPANMLENFRHLYRITYRPTLYVLKLIWCHLILDKHFTCFGTFLKFTSSLVTRLLAN